MLIIHPIFQFLATLAAVYALYLGGARFRSLHLGQRAAFTWKRHVWVGGVALISWLLGSLFGTMLTYVYWHQFFMTGRHAAVALAMAPMIVFGLVSGAWMNRVKKKRPALALIHGVNNLLVIILAIWQIKTGLRIYSLYVLGG